MTRKSEPVYISSVAISGKTTETPSLHVQATGKLSAMKKLRATAAATTITLLLASCTGAAQSDINACTAYQDSLNELHAFTDEALKRADKTIVQLEFAALKIEIADNLRHAAQNAATQELADELSKTTDLVLAPIDDEDAGTAFFLQRRTIVNLCDSIGARIDLDGYDE